MGSELETSGLVSVDVLGYSCVVVIQIMQHVCLC